jgi:hypothetical protein
MAAKSASILLVDEVEFGLEPHRWFANVPPRNALARMSRTGLEFIGFRPSRLLMDAPVCSRFARDEMEEPTAGSGSPLDLASTIAPPTDPPENARL